MAKGCFALLFVAAQCVLSAQNGVLAMQLPGLSRRQTIGVAVGVGLAAGKLYINGPAFKEIVSMDGKTVVITGGNTGSKRACA
jgi:hypothetical protein